MCQAQPLTHISLKNDQIAFTLQQSVGISDYKLFFSYDDGNCQFFLPESISLSNMLVLISQICALWLQWW